MKSNTKIKNKNKKQKQKQTTNCKGSALMTKLVYELQRTNKKYGLQTMCIGWGMATATIVENCYGKILPPYRGNITTAKL